MKPVTAAALWNRSQILNQMWQYWTSGWLRSTGVEATAEISRRYPSVQVVILSMHPTNEYVFRVLQGGASGSVVKESAGRELIDTVVKEGARAPRLGGGYTARGESGRVLSGEPRLLHRSTAPQSRLRFRLRTAKAVISAPMTTIAMACCQTAPKPAPLSITPRMTVR